MISDRANSGVESDCSGEDPYSNSTPLSSRNLCTQQSFVAGETECCLIGIKRANGTDSFTTSRTLSHGIGLWVSETIHPDCLPFLLMQHQTNRTCYQGGSTVRNIEVSVMGIRATPRVTIHEGVGDSVVGVVPGARCNSIPIAVWVGALDRRGIHLARDLYPRRGRYFSSHSRGVVWVGECIGAIVPLLLCVSLLYRYSSWRWRRRGSHVHRVASS